MVSIGLINNLNKYLKWLANQNFMIHWNFCLIWIFILFQGKILYSRFIKRSWIHLKSCIKRDRLGMWSKQCSLLRKHVTYRIRVPKRIDFVSIIRISAQHARNRFHECERDIAGSDNKRTSTRICMIIF